MPFRPRVPHVQVLRTGCTDFDNNRTFPRFGNVIFSATNQLRNFSTEPQIDPYKILGVKSDATIQEIRSAYYAQSKLVHPDKCPTSNQKTNSAEAFHRLTRAYELLSDPVQRSFYDQQSRCNQFSCINNKTAETLDEEFARAREIFLKRQRSKTNYSSTRAASSFYSGLHSDNHTHFIDPRIFDIWSNLPNRKFNPYLKWFLILSGVPLTGSFCYFVLFCEF